VWVEPVLAPENVESDSKIESVLIQENVAIDAKRKQVLIQEKTVASSGVKPDSKEIENNLEQTINTAVNNQLEPILQIITDKFEWLEQKISHSTPANNPNNIATQAEKSNPDSDASYSRPNTHTNTYTKAKTPVKSVGTTTLLDLNYPHQLSTQECEDLQEMLHKADDQAQNLLNLLARRFENTGDPINNPIAYFASLLERLAKHKLDLSGVQDYQIPDPEQVGRDKLIQSLQAEYAQHQSDYQHFEQVIQREMLETGASFEEARTSLKMAIILDDIETKRSKVTQQLDKLL